MYPFAVTSVLLAFTLSVQPALLPVDSLVYQNAMQSVYQYVLNQEGSSPVTGVYDAASLTSLDNTSRGWGQGVRLDEQNRPLGAVNAQETYGQYNAQFIAEASPLIYLTIDEGYENGYTAKILDVLKEKQCPAVFFVTMDYVQENPDLIRRMIDEGHVVGNHSGTHPS